MSIERDLRLLGAELLPPSPDLTAAVVEAIEEGNAPDRVVSRGARSLRPVWAAAASLAVVVLAMLAIPPAREAVAGWLGIGQVRVEQVADLPPVTSLAGSDFGEALALGVPVPVGEARLPASLGPPEVAFADQRQTTTYVWLPGPGLPEVGDSGVGALLSTFVDDGIPIAKQASGETQLLEVTVDGQPALWIAGGPHVVFFDGGTASEGRLAGNTLLWERDGVTYRLEIGLELDAAVSIAESID